MAERPTVFLMVKAPRPGQVKTRLAREIGEMAAVRFHRHNTAAVIRRLRDPRWRLVLAVAPEAATNVHWWPGDLPRISQGHGDLGARMAQVFAQAGAAPALIVGSDIPDITAARVAAAFQALRGAEAVIGPAPDGGYWLIGLRRGPAPRGLFDGVRWSGPHARADTIANLDAQGLDVALADELRDVDDAASYRAAGAANARVIRP
ncbi:TIGR04282 family arsenosugar biosynthesis glycosyltransferase [Dichotomicrobium thermohalophilum]|uniref:Glycosyltransferase n=1 Tax=Dichotomicrobium thermohalophilum TaxID=933063 RepID=A0A397P747_9HYPH|nr:TIGR04282 family arsenosugar biosynthesis glycosyltransferase [Dichotomicrobium thermohalophilum]RIA45386.1 hypothetical protein BXY53_2807 [Dichotomicrobium thermohalophilum]